MIKKNLSRGLQFACALGVVGAVVGATVHTNDTKASNSAPTGVCGLILSGNAAGYTGKTMQAGFPSGQVGLTGIINLSGGTASLTGTDVTNYNSTYAYNVLNPIGNVTVQVSQTMVSEGSGYLVTINPSSNGGLPLLFVPTNNNNTYLVSSYEDQSSDQSGSPYMTGVCQAQ